MIRTLPECILRAKKHNRSFVHQHNMEMNIPLAGKTNLWDSAPNTAVWNGPRSSVILDGACPIPGEFAEVKVHRAERWGSENQALLHKHSDFNNATNHICPSHSFKLASV